MQILPPIKQQIKDNFFALLLVLPTIIATLLSYKYDIHQFVIQGGTQCLSIKNISYLFICTNAMHLVINCIAIFIVFQAFEDYSIFTRFFLFIVFIIAGIICGVCSQYINDTSMYTAGSSGAIYFTFSFLMMEEMLYGEKGKEINHKLSWLVFWAFNVYINYAIYITSNNLIDITNHICGVVLGLLFGYIIHLIRKIYLWKIN